MLSVDLLAGEADETLDDCGNSFGLRHRRRWADTDPIAERRALMKNDGMAAKKMFDMSKGTAPFDLATVQDSLKTLAIAAEKEPTLFPDSSKTGGGTAALPAIWRNKADFDARFAKFAKDVAAAQAGIVDEASFKKLRGPSSRIAAVVTSFTKPRAAES